VIVDSALYRSGQRVDLHCHPHDYAVLREGVHADGDFVWLGLYQPSEEEMADVAEAFGLHPLAVEDALTAHQRPKLERYGDVMFMTLKTLWYVDADDAVETGEISIFMGRDFVVTVRHGRGSQLAPARHLLEATDEPVERVATMAGFGTAANLRQHFTRALGVAPMSYRRTFRGEGTPIVA